MELKSHCINCGTSCSDILHTFLIGDPNKPRSKKAYYAPLYHGPGLEPLCSPQCSTDYHGKLSNKSKTENQPSSQNVTN